MTNLVFYRDSRGKLCARGDEAQVATFLETDLRDQESKTQCLVDRLEDVEIQDVDQSVEFKSHYHCLSIGRDMVAIEAKFDDQAPVRRLRRVDFLSHVRAWLEFLRTSGQ